MFILTSFFKKDISICLNLVAIIFPQTSNKLFIIFKVLYNYFLALYQIAVIHTQVVIRSIFHILSELLGGLMMRSTLLYSKIFLFFSPIYYLFELHQFTKSYLNFVFFIFVCEIRQLFLHFLELLLIFIVLEILIHFEIRITYIFRIENLIYFFLSYSIKNIFILLLFLRAVLLSITSHAN